MAEPSDYEGFPCCQRASEPQVRQALLEFIETTPYPGEAFYRLAYDFYAEVGTVNDQCDILDRWKKTKGSPSVPYLRYCELGDAGLIPREVLKENLEEALKRCPDDARLLVVAYDIAHEEDNWARRLFYALQLSKHEGTAYDFVRYGMECGRNAMPERAEEAFQKALDLDPKNVAAINGLAMCAFERVELGKAEELYRKAQKVEPNDYGKTMLKKIAALRKGEPWVKQSEARKKFWKMWQDTELTKLTEVQRQERMAEVVGRRI